LIKLELGRFVYNVNLDYTAIVRGDMHNKIVKIIMFLGVLLLGAECVNAENIIKPEKSETLGIPLDIYSLSTGYGGGAETLRVRLQIIEPYYCNIYVEVIIPGETECNPSFIKDKYLFESSTLGKKLGVELITGLRFVKWHEWNRFELHAKEADFMLTYNPKDSTFDIKKLKSKR